MVEHIPTDKSDAQGLTPPESASAIAAQQLAAGTARRRILRSGLVGGPVALLAAGKPVKTLASTYYCTFSGYNSVSVSKKGKKGKEGKEGKGKGGTGLSHTPATGSCSAGHPPSYYVTTTKGEFGGTTYKAENWPTEKFSGVTLNSSTTFYELFGNDKYGGMSNTPILTILGEYGTTVEAYMVAAAFNSLTSPSFPYFDNATGLKALWTDYSNNSTNVATLQSFLEQFV